DGASRRRPSGRPTTSPSAGSATRPTSPRSRCSSPGRTGGRSQGRCSRSTGTRRPPTSQTTGPAPPPSLGTRLNPKRAPAAETDRLGDRLGPAIPEHLQRRRIPRIVVEREDRSGGEGEVLAVLARELLGECAVVEVRLGQ